MGWVSATVRAACKRSVNNPSAARTDQIRASEGAADQTARVHWVVGMVLEHRLCWCHRQCWCHSPGDSLSPGSWHQVALRVHTALLPLPALQTLPRVFQEEQMSTNTLLGVSFAYVLPSVLEKSIVLVIKHYILCCKSLCSI